MKRSRAPSSIAGVNGSITRGHSQSSPQFQSLSASHLLPNLKDESQPSLEVDVGMEDLDISNSRSQSNNANSGKGGVGGGRRRSNRGSSNGNDSKGGVVGGGGGGSKRRENGPNRGGGGTRSPTSEAMASVEANGSGSVVKQGGKPRRVSGDGGAKSGKASKGQGSGLREEQQEEDDLSAEGEEDGRRGGGDDGENPPPKKKKKYIRNPETHKAYRARVEAELAQARVSGGMRLYSMPSGAEWTVLIGGWGRMGIRNVSVFNLNRAECCRGKDKMRGQEKTELFWYLACVFFLSLTNSLSNF